jgi:hypothetical protein
MGGGVLERKQETSSLADVVGTILGKGVVIRWWETDPLLAGTDRREDAGSLGERVQRLERELEQRSRSGQRET